MLVPLNQQLIELNHFLLLQSLKNSLHFIVDTASGDHAFDPYLSLLKVGGVMAIVCFPSEIKVHPASLNIGNSLF
jgi:cinnamyl-alcohol dehydrogenase